MRRWLILTSLSVLVLGVAAAIEPSHFAGVPAKDHARVNPMADKPDAATAGASLFKAHCAECHQADASGDGKKKPSLRTPQVKSATDGDLEWFLRQGDLRHGMPSWSGIPQAQRWAIISYLRSLQ